MDRIAKTIEQRCASGAVGSAVRMLERMAEELARVFKEHLLQDVIDQAVCRELGEVRRGSKKQALSPWKCLRCGPRLGSEVRRNGHYLRRPLVKEGTITLRIPQLVCRTCEKAVPFVHPLLPRRKRMWLDIDQQVLQLYLEGCSYRATRRLLERSCRSNVGLMSIWRSFIGTGQAEHAPAERPPAHYLGLDETYHKVKGQKRWFLSSRAQDKGGGKHWVGSALSSDRTQDAWETAPRGTRNQPLQPTIRRHQ